MTSFGLYIGLLNHKNTLEVSKEYDFFPFAAEYILP